MKTILPEELAKLYGTIAISRIATARTTARLDSFSDVREAIKKSEGGAKSKSIDINDLDVENDGFDDEIEDWMREGFEGLIPDFRDPPRKWPPIPTLPPSVVLCARILRALRDAVAERRLQSDAARQLRTLTEALGSNPHPILQLFSALFKAALQEVEERLDALDTLINGLVRSAFSNGCEIPRRL